MRALVPALLVLLALVARGEDGQTQLPFTPFANARAGDYCVEAVGTRTVTTRVLRVDGTAVTISRDGQEETVSTKEPPSVATFLGRFEKSRISAWRVLPDRIDLGGKEVACKRLTFSARSKDEQASVAIWFSDKVKGRGVLLMRVRFHEAQGERTVETRLVEYGSSDAAEWKRKP